MKKCSLSKEREKGLSEPNITLAELITMVQGESMAGSSVTDGDGKVHKMYNPRRESIIRQVTLRAKSNPAGVATLGMITRQAAVIAHLDSTVTSTRRLEVAVTLTMVMVAQGVICLVPPYGEENATNADAKIFSQMYVMQQIKCTLWNMNRAVRMWKSIWCRIILTLSTIRACTVQHRTEPNILVHTWG